MHKVDGKCHCGIIHLCVELAYPPSTYSPRACRCDFCRRQNAAYVSDPLGSVKITIDDERQRGTYRQGSEQADFLFCRNCGVLIGVLHEIEGTMYAAMNANALDSIGGFALERAVSPQTLSRTEKTKRWQEVWFSRVSIRSV